MIDDIPGWFVTYKITDVTNPKVQFQVHWYLCRHSYLQAKSLAWKLYDHQRSIYESESFKYSELELYYSEQLT